MACLELTLTVAAPSSLAVTADTPASLSVETAAAPSVGVVPVKDATLAVVPVQGASLDVEPSPQLRMTVGEVCTVGGGTIVVLAASDGPLRTRDGGFFLLNPETNPAQ